MPTVVSGMRNPENTIQASGIGQFRAPHDRTEYEAWRRDDDGPSRYPQMQGLMQYVRQYVNVDNGLRDAQDEVVQTATEAMLNRPIQPRFQWHTAETRPARGRVIDDRPIPMSEEQFRGQETLTVSGEMVLQPNDIVRIPRTGEQMRVTGQPTRLADRDAWVVPVQRAWGAVGRRAVRPDDELIVVGPVHGAARIIRTRPTLWSTWPPPSTSQLQNDRNNLADLVSRLNANDGDEADTEYLTDVGLQWGSPNHHYRVGPLTRQPVADPHTTCDDCKALVAAWEELASETVGGQDLQDDEAPYCVQHASHASWHQPDPEDS